MIKDKNTTIGYHCPQCGVSILNSVNMFAFSDSAAGNIIKLKCPCGSSELSVNITRDKKFRLTVPCIVCPNSHSYAVSPNILFEKELFAFSCKFTALNICFIGNSNQQVMAAIRDNEQELLETFAEYDDSLDPEITELSDIFGWNDDDDGDLDDDDWFDELFSNLGEGGFGEDFDDDDDGDYSFDDFMRELRSATKGGFEIYKPEQTDADLDDAEKALDLAIYSQFTMHKPESELPSGFDGFLPPPQPIKSYPITSQILATLSHLVKEKKIHCRCGDFDGQISTLESHIVVACIKCGSRRAIKSSNPSDIQYISDMGELYLDFDD